MNIANSIFYLNLLIVSFFFFKTFNIYPIAIVYIIAGIFNIFYPNFSGWLFFFVFIYKCFWLYYETRNFMNSLKCLFFPISIIEISYFIAFDVPRYFFNSFTVINAVVEIALLISFCMLFVLFDKRYSIVKNLLDYKAKTYTGVLIFYVIFIVFYVHHSLVDTRSIEYIWTGLICNLIGIIYIITQISELLVIRQMEKIQLIQINEKKQQDYYEALETFRHDYNNYINILEISLRSGDTKDVQNFLQDQKKFLEIEIRDSLFAELSKIKHMMLHSLVLNFVEVLEKENKEYSIHVGNIINEINISDYDLIRITSNLLKNAVEHSSDSNRPINLTLDIKNNNQFIFTIENPINTTASIINGRIFHKGYSTKKNSNGIGLYSVRKIVSEYKNISIEFHTKKNPLTFEVVLRIC